MMNDSMNRDVKVSGMEKQLEVYYLTPAQKLQALANRFYSGVQWRPMIGDYYTSCRADVELYRVVDIADGVIYTEYCTRPGSLSEWNEATFTTEGFGTKRVWVPLWIVKDMTPDEIQKEGARRNL